MKIREASPNDFIRLEDILIQNNMLTCPEIDGKEAMSRISERMGRYFLVAEIDHKIVGMIRGCYDGSRALIHQMVVDKDYQRQGIGRKMIEEIALRFKSDGAPSISVTATEGSKEYYKKLRFKDKVGLNNSDITLMVCFDINQIL